MDCRGTEREKLPGLTQPGYAGEDMNISINNVDRHPEIVVREDDLLGRVTLVICGQNNHAQLGAECG